MLVNENLTITTILEGDVTVSAGAEFLVTGIVKGNVTAKDNSSFILLGILDGNLICNENSRCLLNGTMNGSIVNNGTCHLSGILNTKSPIPENLIIESGAIINGNTY